MKLIDDYFKLQKEIFKYFGYVEDWKVHPVIDQRDVYWSISDDQIHFSKDKENHVKLMLADYDFEAEGVDGGDCYSNDIGHDAFLPKYIYRGQDLTMVLEDTHTDGNVWLGIYDNDKEVKRATENSAEEA